MHENLVVDKDSLSPYSILAFNLFVASFTLLLLILEKTVKENWGIEEAKSETGGISECLNRILELDVEESEASGVKNSQADYQQTQERFPILIICDTKMLETDDYDILTALCKKNEVAIITLSSLIGDATTDKYLIDSSKVKKLLLQNAAKLESQINLSQEGAQNQQYLEISLDETVKPSTTKSIFPSIPKLNHISILLG